MPALSEMSPEERKLHGHNPNKERYVKANRWRRELTLQQAYVLRDELDKKARNLEEYETVLQEWAQDTGQSIDALKEEARWTGSVRLEDIRLAFAERLIPDPEWQMRLGTSHIKQAAVAREQDTGRALTSQEKAELLVECFHQNWTVAEFKAVLRERGLKKPEKAKTPKPIPQSIPTTANALLVVIGTALSQQGTDVTLDLGPKIWDKPRKVLRCLRWLAERYEEHYPGLEFGVGEAQTRQFREGAKQSV